MTALQIITPGAMNQILLGIRVQLNIPGALHLHLYQNDFNPLPTSLIGDFVEATFDGYALQATALNTGPYREVDNSFTISGNANWAMTGSVTPNVIYGCYLTDFTNALLWLANRFDTPIPMVDAFSLITAKYTLSLPVNGLPGGLRQLVP